MTIKEESAYTTINKYMPRIAEYLEKISMAITVLALTKELEESKENDKKR